MRFDLTQDRRRRALAIALGAVCAALFLALMLRTQFRRQLYIIVPFSLGVGALVALPLLFRIEVRSWWGLVLANGAIAGCSVFILCMPMYSWKLVPMTKSVITDSILVMALLCLLTAVTADVKIFGILWMTVCLIFGIIDCAVVQFRGNLITLSDFNNINTAISVAAQYHLKITPCIVLAVLLYLAALLAVLRLRAPRANLRRLPLRLTALVCALACGAFCLYYYPRKKPRMFRGKGIIYNGLLGEFITELMDSFITPPKGYSDDRVRALSAENAGTPAAETASEKPHVIAVMVESFTDLSVLGDFQVDADYLPFTHSIADESIHGWVASSTISGGTARSEWEFLTGNSMAFMPSGCMPYGQYMSGDENSVVKVFENAGYHTVAMHPYYANGWHRNTVYPAFGFDETCFLEDSDWDGYVRKFVSDSAFVHKLIQVFEERPKDQPLFFFGVTMQDHGGYEYEDFVADVHAVGLSRDYPEIDQFLSLIKLSDDAMRELVEYFRNTDEKVQIVFFGDHQPILPTEFAEELGLDGQLRRHVVPFVIWNNYDQKVEEVPLTSINFLMPRVLKEIGLDSAPYFNFLNELSQTVPSLSTNGYLEEGVFHFKSEGIGDALADYRIFQYANMFRHNLDESLFVGSAE